MITRFTTIFDLDIIKRYANHDHLLIVTSRGCKFCHEFKAYWEEIAEAIGENRITYHLEVEDVGGPLVFIQGMGYFFEKRLPLRLGYPSFFGINASKNEVALVGTPVYWDAETQTFDKEGLIAHILKGVGATQ